MIGIQVQIGNNYSHQTFGRWNTKTRSVIVLRLSKWHHKWKRRYHLCYRAKIVLNKNTWFTLDNSICEKHKCGDHGYKCENYYFIIGTWFTKPNKKITKNKYEPEVVLKDKVYLETYYKDQLRSVDENTKKIKA